MRGEHPELLHHTALDLGGGRGRSGRGDSLAPRPSLSLYHHYLLTPLGPEAGSHPPQPPCPKLGLTGPAKTTQTAAAATSVTGEHLSALSYLCHLGSPSPALGRVILTFAVSEVQSLVPLGTLQLAIFNHRGG